MIDAMFVLGVLLVTVAVALFLSGPEASVVLVIAVLGAIVGRAQPIITIVKAGYQSQGWATIPT
jgi:hypothetical protein